MIPIGKYKARGVEAALGMTKSGNEQIAVLVEITHGDYAGDQLTWYGHFTDKTTERTFESLRALGWEGDDLMDLRGIGSNEVTIVIEHEEGNDGRVRARVKWINSGGGGLAMKERLDEGSARAFAARMKGAAIASRSKGGPKPQSNGGTRPQRQPVRDEPSPFDDDGGVPF